MNEEQVNPNVSFTKNSINNFDSTTDTFVGRIYFRKNGIFISILNYYQ